MIAQNTRSSTTSSSAIRDVEALIESAADVVAPQWPLATFAARSPWLGLEDRSFDDVARWYAALNGLTLYPDAAHLVVRAGEPEGMSLLSQRLGAWLAQKGYPVHDALLERFCLSRLNWKQVPFGMETSRWKKLAADLPRIERHGPDPVRTRSDFLARRGEPRASQASRILEATTIRWLKLFAGRLTSGFSIGEGSLYDVWREQARLDIGIPRAARRRLTNLPATAHGAIAATLQELAPPDRHADYLRAHLAALPGWAGMLRWSGREDGRPTSLLADFLALRLTLEASLLEGWAPRAGESMAPDSARDTAELLHAWSLHAGLDERDWRLMEKERARQCLELAADFDELACARVRLEAQEWAYRTDLQSRLREAARTERTEPVSQLVFCIDVRSEPLRRALEAAGPFETFGYAGFFGLPIRTRELEGARTHAACPVILTPEREVGEHAEPRARQRYRKARAMIRHRFATRDRLKGDPLASLAMPEFEGAWRGLGLFWNSFVPTRWRRRLRGTKRPAKPATVPAVGEHGDQAPEAQKEQAAWAANALRGIGLTRDFAPLVLFVGHGSASRNNPYMAKLLCGACGGAAGGFNARVLAALCNDAAIRRLMAAQGVSIPTATRFMAAEHQTSLDELLWLDEAPSGGSARQAFDALQDVLPDVCARVRSDRVSRLPDPFGGRRGGEDAVRRAEDWSETRPEWGLARNASIIIGRRAWTKGHDLEGRAFLHGYDWEHDPDGSLLAGIIAGPVTVAQWINLQYYASTVAPGHEGSGGKATQTVTAGFGVMQGNGSDLVAGLPWQAVMIDDTTPYHVPQRLLVVIEAPETLVARLLADQPGFAQKVANGWLLLTSYDPDSGRWTDW